MDQAGDAPAVAPPPPPRPAQPSALPPHRRLPEADSPPVAPPRPLRPEGGLTGPRPPLPPLQRDASGRPKSAPSSASSEMMCSSLRVSEPVGVRGASPFLPHPRWRPPARPPREDAALVETPCSPPAVPAPRPPLARPRLRPDALPGSGGGTMVSLAPFLDHQERQSRPPPAPPGITQPTAGFAEAGSAAGHGLGSNVPPGAVFEAASFWGPSGPRSVAPFGSCLILHASVRHAASGFDHASHRLGNR